MRVVERLIAGPTGYSALDLELEPEHILGGALIGIAAALYVAAIMRRGLRPAAKKRIAMPADRAAPRRISDGGSPPAGLGCVDRPGRSA